MADKYDNFANENLLADKSAESVNITGNKTVTAIEKLTLSPDHGAGAVYRLFKVGADMIPVSLEVLTEGVAGASSCDIGIYEEGIGGKALNAKVFADGLSLAEAAGVEKPLNGLKSLTLENVGKEIWNLAGDKRSNRATGYDICVTANAAATAEGTAVFKATFVQG